MMNCQVIVTNWAQVDNLKSRVIYGKLESIVPGVKVVRYLQH